MVVAMPVGTLATPVGVRLVVRATQGTVGVALAPALVAPTAPIAPVVSVGAVAAILARVVGTAEARVIAELAGTLGEAIRVVGIPAVGIPAVGIPAVGILAEATLAAGIPAEAILAAGIPVAAPRWLGRAPRRRAHGRAPADGAARTFLADPLRAVGE